MDPITRIQDASSIISPETARELEERQRQVMAAVGKSGATDPVLVVKSETDTPAPVANPFLLAYRSSVEGQAVAPTSFAEQETARTTDEQLTALSECVYRGHAIVHNIFSTGTMQADRQGLIIKALEDELGRAYEITERASKKGKKPAFLFDDDDEAADEEESDGEDEDDEEDMKKKSLGEIAMNELVERANTLGVQLDAIAAGPGNRETKYLAAQSAIESYVGLTQQAIDSVTPATPVVNQSMATDQVSQQILAGFNAMQEQMVAVTRSLGLVVEKLNRAPEIQYVSPQISPASPVQPVARSLTPALGNGQIEQAGVVQQQPNDLRSLVRAQYGLGPAPTTR